MLKPPLAEPTAPANNWLACQMLWISGFVLVFSGIFHVGVWAVQGGAWEGPVSWRKPILFGLSTGMTLLSMAWICSKLPSRKWDSILCGLFSCAMIAEVALISIQQWRGEASHFNRSSTFNGFIESWMTYLITFATLVLIEITRRCFLTLQVPKDMKLAIRSGMAFLIGSCLIGFAILIYGSIQTTNDADPSVFGQRGVTKFPHGVAIHAIQLFPFAGWLFRKLGIPEEKRVQLIWYLVASTAAFLVFSLVQTLAGNARFEFTLYGTPILVAALILLLPVAKSLVLVSCCQNTR